LCRSGNFPVWWSILYNGEDDIADVNTEEASKRVDEIKICDRVCPVVRDRLISDR